MQLVPTWATDKSRLEILKKRAKIISSTRKFFEEKGFLEVETPSIAKTPDPNPNIETFKTTFKARGANDVELFLSSSPEHHMKIILCSGIEKIFQVTRFFRNGETGVQHNHEFTGLEWYQTGIDYKGVMETCEELLLFLSMSLHGTDKILYQGKRLDLSGPWPRITVNEAFIEFAGIDLRKCTNTTEFKKIAKLKKELAVFEHDTWETLFFKTYIHYVEKKLTGDKPIFLTDYPVKLSSLARVKPGDPLFVERFEIFAGNMELGNAFSELNDPVEQKKRFIEDLQKKYPNIGEDELPVDYKLLNALEYGLPPCGGIAMGLDRVIMLLLNCADIKDVMFFPGV